MPAERGRLLAGQRVPKPDCPVFTGRGEAPAVGAPRQAKDRAAMTAQDRDVLTVGSVPDLNRLVLAAGSQPFPIGTPSHSENRSRVRLPPVGEQFLAVRRVPDSDGSIPAGGSESPPVRAPRNRPDRTLGTVHDPQPLSVGSVPEQNYAVSIRRGQTPAVRTPGHCQDAVVVHPKGEQIAMAQTVQVIPLPVAQIGPVFLRGGKQLADTGDAAGRSRRL